MDTESRIKELESELQETREELRQILLDIRIYLMEVLSPIPNDLDKEKLREELQAGKGVKPNGS
ncbi:MAG: hypothetical protein A2144_09310 [Chloroflexi bacterium RBG_16_50_9]|nr:MAG: hypothetical protein A2144_09310 [Chloroflexi bacterium RBG_16_50_9]